MEAIAVNQLDNPAVRAVVANSRDISARMAIEEERRRLADQLVRARALESLATLAGGVAHDFNNLLAVIVGETDLLKMDTTAEERQCSLENIGRAARNAAELTSLLLAYAGRGRYRCEPVDLVSLVARRQAELEHLLGQSIHLEVALGEKVRSVEADEAKLWQILESLVANAAEAFEQPSGEVRLEVGMTLLTEQELQGAAFETLQEPGPAVYLKVADTARGMEPAVVQKIFEPFFSTKSTGRGLGLAAVAGLVRGFRGTIRVESQPQVGTTFTLYFRPSRESIEPRPEPPTGFRGDGLALVIDDEPAIAIVTARVLDSLGFTTAVAYSGADALQLYGHRLNDVRLVVLDMMMPEMNGGETFHRLRELRPNLPVLFYSGYAGDIAQEELRAAGTRFLQKPFSRDLLGKTLQQLLGEPWGTHPLNGA
jgi:signal transduction histidine kinase/CheY-like chemotaxis protein